MTVEAQGLLLQIARDAIACSLGGGKPSKLQDLEAQLLQKSGAFVLYAEIWATHPHHSGRCLFGAYRTLGSPETYCDNR